MTRVMLRVFGSCLVVLLQVSVSVQAHNDSYRSADNNTYTYGSYHNAAPNVDGYSQTPAQIGTSRQNEGHNYGSYYPDQVRQYPNNVPYPYPSMEYPPAYYGPPGGCYNCPQPMMENFLLMGATKLGLLGVLKAGLAALGTGLITKLPFFLVKLLIKLVLVPVGLVLFGLPAVLPFVLPLLSMLIPLPFLSAPSFGSTSDTGLRDEESPVAAVRSLLESDQCLERIACQLGAYNSHSPYNKPVSWLLNYMQESAPHGKKLRLKAYRDAYMSGVERKTCGEEKFRCGHIKTMFGRE